MELQLGKYEFFPYDDWYLDLIDKLDAMRRENEKSDELSIEEKLKKLRSRANKA